MKRAIAIVLAATLAACTASDDAERALKSAGYKDIQITGYDLFGCSKDDQFHTGFEATSGPGGGKVRGVVCSGFLKGSTIRTY